MPLGTGTARLFASSAQLDLLRRPSHTSITIRRRERVSERSHCEAADEGPSRFSPPTQGQEGIQSSSPAVISFTWIDKGSLSEAVRSNRPGEGLEQASMQKPSGEIT